jgi:hypothetical protein
MKEHLNYCRQLLKVAPSALALPVGDENWTDMWRLVPDLCSESVKFLLPENGIVLDDKQLRGLDDDADLRLPFNVVALEWRATGEVGPDQLRSSKRVLFAQQFDEAILCASFCFIDSFGSWLTLGALKIPTRDFAQRTKAGVEVAFDCSADLPTADFVDEVTVLYGFLNALSCCNVAIERSEPRHGFKKPKGALPFDAYHVLTVKQDSKSAGEALGGTHRSPREHLRRGHMRRLSDGRKVWVNATVVAAGRGSGVVKKDYLMRREVEPLSSPDEFGMN